MRKIGSGNIGATNVLRTGHKGLAAATLLLDLLKGTVAVLLVVRDRASASCAFDAYPVCAYVAGPRRLPRPHLSRSGCAFEGGKGVATFIGVLIGVHWPAALVFCLVWAGVAAATRYSSLAALAATVAVVLYYLLSPAGLGLLFILIMSALIFVKHHANIRRLLAGEESKIGARS